MAINARYEHDISENEVSQDQRIHGKLGQIYLYGYQGTPIDWDSMLKKKREHQPWYVGRPVDEVIAGDMEPLNPDGQSSESEPQPSVPEAEQVVRTGGGDRNMIEPASGNDPVLIYGLGEEVARNRPEVFKARFDVLRTAGWGLARFVKHTKESATAAKDTVIYWPGLAMAGLYDRFSREDNSGEEIDDSSDNKLAEASATFSREGRFNDRVRKLALAAGGLAITAVVGAAIYKYGLPHGGGAQRAHENVQQLIPARPSVAGQSGFISPAQTQVVGKLVEHSQKAFETAKNIKNSVRINVGDGYTQAIQRTFPGHSPAEYLQGYKETIKQLGPNFLKGVKHYHMASGDWGLSGSGKAHMTNAAYHLLSKFFSSQK